ncbi:glycosyltransferase [uncultured Clostridium sp.]|uniref:MGDG synthase family glycosyltransferase n=1 Tax=uncultured Clostridium sp. TaxID=59620 RepID=UPI002603D2AA|nr:glycosyltransferase [uncultured Clostridium sp.]
MKKILILSASTGQGHNQAANSLKVAFENQGFITSKQDFLQGSSKLLLALVVGSYEVSAMKFPLGYGLFYKLTNNPLINPLSTIPFYFIRKRMFKLIQEEKPDLIVTTHPLSICLVDGLKRMGVNVPIVSIVTDFKPHYTYISKKIDLYIAGSQYTKDVLIKKGINANIVHPLGIPIKDTFFKENTDIAELHNSDDYFNILLMSGSMGLEDISFVLEELLKNERKLRVTVICGNNKELKRNLDKHLNKEYKNKKLHILGFSTDIASFMEYSDILISKPGGLTVTESVAKDLPLIIPFAIPGQETENTEFLVSSELALKISHMSDINPLINDLIDNPEKLEDLKNRIKTLRDTYSVEKTVKVCSDLINK